MIIPEIKQKIYPNNKPWITKDIRNLLQRKHVAFRDGNYEEKRKIQKEITKEIHRSKQRYGKNIEKSFGQKGLGGSEDNNRLWEENDLHIPPGNINSFVNELNQFYARFDAFDFRLANYDLCSELQTQVKDSEKTELSLMAIEKSLRKVKAKKRSDQMVSLRKF